ncbi:MAG: hypothetical protein H6721_21670 [Sandaracinus sp.]|nr:hypothetical protein [Sandaracinus sp.]
MWRVEYDPTASLLSVRMLEVVTARDARDLTQAAARALEATGGAPFRACFDMRKLFPLEEDCVHLVEALKRTCLEWTGCRGLVVLADSPTVAMQQHHTRVRPGTDHELELVTLDKTSVDAFLARPVDG